MPGPVRRRNHQLVRCLRLQRLLEQGRWTRAELAQRLNVTMRTLYRDLNALDEAHIGWARIKVSGEPVRYHRDVA